MPPIHFYIDQWSRLPPNVQGDQLAGKTVILTGATSGIGLEAAHQLAVLKPGKLIITARSTSGGAEAIDAITKRTPGVNVDCWELNMSKFDSVKAFGERANRELDKLDILMANAGMQTGFDPARKIDLTGDEHENTVQTNVLSTILLALLLHPVLAKAAKPRIVFTTSETAGWAESSYVAKAAANGGVLKTFDSPEKYVNPTRYFQSKLLLQLVVRHLIPAMPDVNIISTNPGLCYSRLGRNIEFKFTLAGISQVAWYMANARSAAAGARTIVWSAVEAPDESCEYSTQCHLHYFESPFLSTKTGMKVAEQFYHEVLDELEGVVPGCTKVLKGV